ncbi:hypothetical protein OIU85_006668 [Salix viminalis]|uniref:Uncharacterized protein n=1 Tax=Salix viminalis TaxID=40686 RepID=A0A9Q0PM66_SALVM|nr:hypothetical protein OIU85_006668 [Salix viminalis]
MLRRTPTYGMSPAHLLHNHRGSTAPDSFPNSPRLSNLDNNGMRKQILYMIMNSTSPSTMEALMSGTESLRIKIQTRSSCLEGQAPSVPSTRLTLAVLVISHLEIDSRSKRTGFMQQMVFTCHVFISCTREK